MGQVFEKKKQYKDNTITVYVQQLKADLFSVNGVVSLTGINQSTTSTQYLLEKTIEGMFREMEISIDSDYSVKLRNMGFKESHEQINS